MPSLKKDFQINTKVIIALDYANESEAFNLVNQLDPTLSALKVGSEMFTLFGQDFVRELVQKGFKVFLDLKFHDIPNTVANACKAAAELGVWMINVHASGGLNMMKAAKEALSSLQNPPLLIAVTVLTSMSEEELSFMGIKKGLEQQVKDLAFLAKQAHLDGVVCSAHEVPMIKDYCGKSFLTITPGIRLNEDKADDQVRIMTPKDAIALGADHLVIGRPITKAENPLAILKSINKLIA